MKRLLTMFTVAFSFSIQPFCVLAEGLDFATAEFTPYVFEENGKITGIHVDIVTEACRELGIEPTFHFMPWKRCLFTAKTGVKYGYPFMHARFSMKMVN